MGAGSRLMKIGIVGLGLIGGSLGLDFRALGHHVYGVSRNPKNCEIALGRKAVHEVSCSLSLMAEAELVFICTPLGVMQSVVGRLVPHLLPHTILTDVGSVKTTVVETLSLLWPRF